jgi:hypothetical protein
MQRSLLLAAIALIGCTKPAAEAPPAASGERVERLVVKVSDMTAAEESQHAADRAAAEARYAELEREIETSTNRGEWNQASLALAAVQMESSRRIRRDGRAKAAAWYRAELESLDVDKLITRGRDSFEY